MNFSIDYKITYTWRKPDSKYCYTETKYFNSELERNRYGLELFSNAKQGKIVLEFVQESNIQTWRK